MSLEDTAVDVAVGVVRDAGGAISFDDYDSAMAQYGYFVPINWIAGWGLPPAQRKANTDKLAAFKACERGLLMQTSSGYALAQRDA
jgi:hypothetical protein